MGLIQQLIAPLEKLINEHGSAAILREHLDLIKAKAAEYERRNEQLETENRQMQAGLLQNKDRILELERQLEAISKGQNAGFCCDACGSANIKRTGSRPDPTFGDLGIKQGLFTCNQCGHISAYTIDPK